MMMSGVMRRVAPVVVEPLQKATASLIWLHGSGSNGYDMREWTEACLNEPFTFPHIRIIYPNATARPYTPCGGMLSTVWFDRKQISPFCAEDEESTDESCAYVESLVEEEVKKGIERSRIIVGGFSMGGALALHHGYRMGSGLAGVFALSGFLNESSVVYEAIKSSDKPLPPLFQGHGGRDQLVLYDWGKKTHTKLKELGVKGEFHSFPNIYHEISRSVMRQLTGWVNGILPS